MALHPHELKAISPYLPPNTAARVIEFMHSYKIHLKIKRERKTILGDYRPAHNGKPHTISVNGNLNVYHFLITFLHELAHLITHLNHARAVNPHGKEWKQVFALLLKQFTNEAVFPKDVEDALQKSMSNLSASTCSDPDLFKILRRYDEQDGKMLIEQIPIGENFQTEDNRLFKVKEKRRTRFVCQEISTGKQFLFPSIYEVWKV